jgi:hypothetical protein
MRNRGWIAEVVLMGWVVSAVPSQLSASLPSKSSREVLPDDVVPLHYELSVHPDPRALTFTATVRIDVQVRSDVSTIVLNAKQLTFDTVRLEDGRIATVILDSGRETASLRFAGRITKGQHRLEIDYRGRIGRGTLGFFAMDSEAPGGGARRTLATNFEPASERMLMPSWDQPDRKATFRVSVDAPADEMAVANMPIESETPFGKGLKRVQFATTPRMSTYLLFLAVGDYERISESVDGTDVGVVVAKGEAERGRFALTEAARLLRYFNGYFGVRYPLPKLDLVVAAGRIQGGSMENWGGILYSQEHLLFDRKTSTEADRQLVFLVVSHEMAHQWFGDLVTMQWWNDIWLNEGFARWMQTKAADDLHPEWKTGLQASWIVEQGMRADAKPSTHPVEQPIISPAEAELAFDEITYDKGASVVGMIESYVGPDRFRQGLRTYMHDHAYGNTVSSDLWRALEQAAGKPVQTVAQDFTRRAGLPLVSVESGAAGAPLRLRQSRFVEDGRSGEDGSGQRPWHMPLGVGPSAAKAFPYLMATQQMKLRVAGDRRAMLVNAGRQSYTRIRYDANAIQMLASGFAGIDAVDQIALIQDSWALGQSGYAPMADFMTLAQALPPEADPIVWIQLVRILVGLDRSYDGLPGQSGYRAWARARLQPLFQRIGWRPAPSDTAGATLLRAPLLLALSRFGDETVIARARAIDTTPALAEGSAETLRTAHQIAARNADAPSFDHMVATLEATSDPLTKQRQLEALAMVADPALAERTLALVIGPQAPAGSTPNLLAAVAAEHPDLAWRFTEAHLDDPGVLSDRATRMIFVSQIPMASSDPARGSELEAYASAHLPAAAGRLVQAAAAQIQLNASVRSRRIPMIDAWLDAHPAM